MFVAVLGKTLRVLRTVVQGGHLTFAQGGDGLQHPRLLRRYFYAGEIPAVSYPNSRGGELQVISFQKEKSPVAARKV